MKKPKQSKPKLAKPKPKVKVSEPHFDYHEVIDYIEDKYKISVRGYTPKKPLSEERKAAIIKHYGTGSTYLDFWHYILDGSEIHNGSYFYMNLLGDHQEGKADDDGDWDGDDDYRPSWVREIQKMIYDEFKDDLEYGEMRCWVAW